MAIATHRPISQTTSASDLDVVAKIDPQDYDVVADLDELIAWDENNVWEDKPTLCSSRRIVGSGLILRYRAGAAATAIATADGRRSAWATGRPEYGTSARTGRSKHGTFTRTGGSQHT